MSVAKGFHDKARGEFARFGTTRVGPGEFPVVPWPEALKVAPPWEGGDGRATNPNLAPTGRPVDAGVEAKAALKASQTGAKA